MSVFASLTVTDDEEPEYYQSFRSDQFYLLYRLPDKFNPSSYSIVSVSGDNGTEGISSEVCESPQDKLEIAVDLLEDARNSSLENNTTNDELVGFASAVLDQYDEYQGCFG